MIIPPYLKSGDTIALLAASRFIEEELLERSKLFFTEMGFNVLSGPNILQRYHQFAGTDEQRASDINWALENEEVKAIIFMRGGYGAARVIDKVNWDLLRTSPKWVCGYSDVCALHQHINGMGIQSWHSTMPVHLLESDEESILSIHALTEVLKGEPVEYYMEVGGVVPDQVKGRIFGGNLSVIYSLIGSPSDFIPEGSILFLEDLDEYVYHIDRMMNALSRAGKFDKLKALVAGSFTDMNDNTVPFGKDAVEIIKGYAEKHKLPFYHGFPAGHQKLNVPIRLGAEVMISNAVMTYV